MKTLRIACAFATTVLLTTTDLWAAEAARQDNSGIFVWAFLGLCALIVTAQVMPALFMLYSAARGIAESVRKREKVAVTATTKG